MPLQVATGVWHHAVLVYNGQNVYLYIDNVLAELDPAIGTASLHTTNSFHCDRVDSLSWPIHATFVLISSG